MTETVYDVDVVPIEGVHDGQSAKPKRGGPGGLVTLTTVVGLLVATGLTLFGIGSAENAVANFDSNSWMWSSAKSEVDRVNGITAKVDTRTKVKDALNHDLQLSQNDRFLILRDLTTGQVSALDLSTLQVNAVMKTAPGVGVTVALHDDIAFVIDSVQGQVRQLDPRTLSPTGELLAFPPGITAGSFDGKGLLWVAVPSEGTVVGITPGATDGKAANGAAGTNPRVARTVGVATPNHDLALTVLDSGVAVLDNTLGKVVRVVGDAPVELAVPITKPGTLPERTVDGPIPVTVAEDRHVFVVNETGSAVTDFTVPGAGPLDPAVTFAGHVYCPDPRAGRIYEYDETGKLVKEIKISTKGGGLDLEVREDHLFINAPDGSTARVVDRHHKVSDVDKYQNHIPGDDPPPPPPPPPTPPKPPVGPPGKPKNVNASAGDRTARVTWRPAFPNGSAITKYVVEGGPKAVTVGANQRSVQIDGLTNGTTYRFRVHAVNAKGAGPEAVSNPVMPTSDVPDPPTEVNAEAKPDGTVEVSWPAANGQGHKIVRYTVISASDGTQTPLGDVKTTKMKVAAGTLEYGTQYAFIVVSINDKGGGSKPSEPSDTVVPFTVPDAPANLAAAAVPTAKGTVRVTWDAADENGRQIEKYVVEANGTSQDVTDANEVTLDGLGDDKAVTVKVAAVNEAGDGPTATATARTIGVPTVTFTRDSADYRSLTVTFTPNNKNGTATCKVSVSGVGSKSAGCTTQPVTMTLTGMWPNNTYDYTISITNAAGSASVDKSQATSTMRATVLCDDASYCGAGIYIYSTTSQSNPNNALGRYSKGQQFTPVCNVGGGNVNASPWGGKNTAQWLRLTYQGKTAYFPWAWAALDGGDDLANIPNC